jgi:hypothetical protein
MRKVNPIAAVSAIVLVGALSGFAGANAASAPSIYGCVSKAGALSKVSLKSHACPKGTSKISWGSKGLTGLRGLQGLQGLKGDQGDQGIQGEQGEQGPAGTDGGGVTVYNGFDYGQTDYIVDWSAGAEGDYRIVTTTNSVPEGNYLVTANSTFRYGNTGAAIYSCWVSLDVNGSYINSGQFSQDPGGPAPMASSTRAIAVSMTGVVVVPAGGSNISLSCSGDPSFMNYESSITALKIVSLNPTE